MPRSMRNAALETRTQRLKFPPGKRYHWVRLGYGLGLGYRRNQSGSGTWSLRVARGGNRGHWIKLLGTADDYDTANGNTVLDFWQASDRARAFGLKARTGAEDDGGKFPTVIDALATYESDLKLRGGDTDNVGRVRRHLPRGLAGKDVPLLKAHDFKAWRANLTAAGLAAASINRSGAALRAALNHCAAHDERITNRRAWEIGLASIPDAAESRNVILDEPTVRAIVAAAYQVGDEFGLLAEVAATTGARVGQIANLTVGDLQAARADPRLMMPSSKKGRSVKKVTRRPVPIPASLAVRLLAVAQGRPAEAPLLVNPNGEAWRKWEHLRPFRRALALAQIDDDADVTLYALRHSAIVRQLLSGTPIRLVAATCDTSVGMIEKNYAKYIADVGDVPVRRGQLDLSTTADTKVIPLVRS
jgi:integrase